MTRETEANEMKSKIFYSDTYFNIQKDTLALFEKHKDFLSRETSRSTRAAGDAIERIIGDNYESIIKKHISEYSSDFARRSMADLAFKDNDGIYYIVDVKTHREDTYFNMPNITSVRRLARFYEDDNNYFVLLTVKYKVDDAHHVDVSEIVFAPIEFFDWSCLTMGALGWGQIQIANSNKVTINQNYSRKQWMVQMCDVLLDFYPKEVSKITERIDYFKSVREFWAAKEE
jgi:hypothetical protein